MNPLDSNGRHRVVVTGLGAVTGLGNNPQSTWEAVLAGRSGVRQIRQFLSDAFPVRIGGEVDLDTIPLGDLGPDIEKLLTRSIRFGIWGLEQAWEDAGLTDDAFDPWRAGVCIGASNFPIIEDDFAIPQSRVFDDQNYAEQYLEICREMPELLAQRDISMVSTLLSYRHPLKGISLTVQSACASANQAIGEAFQMIRHGKADLIVAGGADSMLSAVCVTGFTLLSVASFYQGDPKEASRPFDRKRDGLVLGEGAGIVILESLEHAQKRGAPIHAEIIGYGSSCDGFRFTDSHPDAPGPIRCMKAALADAGITPEDIDYINAHGTATPQNDRTETLAIKRALGDHAYNIPISSNKSQLGHLLCAAGGIELVMTILSLQNGIAPPTINLDNPDPDCDLDYVPHTPRDVDMKVALSNSFGFGGQNSTLIVRRWDG